MNEPITDTEPVVSYTADASSIPAERLAKLRMTPEMLSLIHI